MACVDGISASVRQVDDYGRPESGLLANAETLFWMTWLASLVFGLAVLVDYWIWPLPENSPVLATWGSFSEPACLAHPQRSPGIARPEMRHSP